jgi:hypothetical protein
VDFIQLFFARQSKCMEKCWIVLGREPGCSDSRRSRHSG